MSYLNYFGETDNMKSSSQLSVSDQQVMVLLELVLHRFRFVCASGVKNAYDRKSCVCGFC